MNVLLVSSGSGSRGGGEIYLGFLAKGLFALGAEVTILIPDAGRMDELAARLSTIANVERFAFTATYQRRTRTLGAFFDRAQRRHMTALFAGHAPDVVHINQQVAEDGVDLVQAAAASGLPWVSTIHIARSAAALGAALASVRDRISIYALRQAGGPYIAVSDASRDQLAARFGANSPRLAVVHNGVPAPDPDTLSAAREDARAAWGARDSDVVIGTVGRIEAQKNPLALVDHVAPVRDRVPVRLAWIGDGTLRGDLEAHAAAVGVPLVVDGWRTDAALRLAGLDLFLLPSRYEGLPLALLEAMHAGLPVLASRADGVVEAVEEGITGFLAGNAAEWRDAVQQTATDPALRATLGAQGRRQALARFSVEAMARATLDVYRSAGAGEGAKAQL